jgi:hypothetical protein
MSVGALAPVSTEGVDQNEATPNSSSVGSAVAE